MITIISGYWRSTHKQIVMLYSYDVEFILDLIFFFFLLCSIEINRNHIFSIFLFFLFNFSLFKIRPQFEASTPLKELDGWHHTLVYELFVIYFVTAVCW